MTWVFSLLAGKAKQWLLGLGTILAAIGFAWLKGRQSVTSEIRRKSAEDRAKYMEAIAEDAAETADVGPDDAREWLHNFGGRE